MTYDEIDLQLIVTHSLEAKMGTSVVFDVAKLRERLTNQMLKNEREHPGYISKTADALRNPEGSKSTVLDPLDAFRRLYNVKWNDMARTGLPHADRVGYAMDYAASELQRCNVGPMPPGGVVALEDGLRAELREPRFPA